MRQLFVSGKGKKKKNVKVSQIRIGPRFGRLPVEKTLNAWHRFCMDNSWNTLTRMGTQPIEEMKILMLNLFAL